MKCGWVRGSLVKHQNQLEVDSKRKHFSRIEVRLRHRKQKFLKKSNLSEEEASSGNNSNSVNSSSFSRKKSNSQFCQETLCTSDTNNNSPRLHKKQEIELSDMVQRDLPHGLPKNFWKIISKSKSRKQSPHLSDNRPRSAPSNPLFRIKCAKQVDSARIVDDGRGFTDEKFETRSTRSACSSRSQDEQFTTFCWPTGMGESLLQNESFEDKKPSANSSIMRDDEKNESGTKSHADLKTIELDYNRSNYEEMFKNIPKECPKVYRNTDEPQESVHEELLHLISKGCDDDFSDEPLSSPERMDYQTRRSNWDNILEKQEHHLSPKIDIAINLEQKVHIQASFPEQCSPRLAVTRPRSEHLGIKCCGYPRYGHCICSKRSGDFKPLELFLKKDNKLKNLNEFVDSKKAAVNETTAVSMEDAACSPRRPSFCNLEIPDSENNQVYDLGIQSAKTTRSVSTQVESNILHSARDKNNKKSRYQCQQCFRSDQDYIAEEIPQSPGCAKCKNSFQLENDLQDYSKFLASENRRLLDYKKNSISEQNHDCQKEELNRQDNVLQCQRQVVIHSLSNVMTCGHTLMEKKKVCFSGTTPLNNSCCHVSAERFQEGLQPSYLEFRKPPISCSKLPVCKNDQQVEGRFFCCERLNDTCCCMCKLSSNPRKIPSCSSPDHRHNSSREISCQATFGPCLLNGNNDFNDGTENESLKRRDINERRFHANKSHSKVESLSTSNATHAERFMSNKFYPHKSGDDHRLFFCNEIMNKHQDILRSCMRNQPVENKTRVSVFRASGNTNSDNEWSASPEEDISGNEVIFPKETRHAMNHLCQAKRNLLKNRHLKRELRKDSLREESEEEADLIAGTENEMMCTSSYAKALAVFQKGCVPSVQTDFKRNRNHLQKKGIGGK